MSQQFSPIRYQNGDTRSTRASTQRKVEGNAITNVLVSDALATLRQTFTSMEAYKFSEDELDLGRGLRRISAIQKVLEYPSANSGSGTPHSQQ